jgi:XTP/dITP diphosphohydrolase
MSKIVTFVTGNETKFEIAKSIFLEYEITLVQEKIDTPEIQDLDVENVAKYSAINVSNELQKSIIVNDVGYYIPALNGFPGSFLKFANDWFNSNQILELMKNKTDRRLIIRDCLAYCEVGKEPITMMFENECNLANEAEGSGSTFDNLIIRKGLNKVQSLYTHQEMLEYWNNHLEHYHKLANYLSNCYVR